VDLTISTRRPERERACIACGWDWASAEAGPPAHSCQTPPAVPLDQVLAQARADDQVIADEEGAIRRRRLVDIRRGKRA
jgi:hypothetical protein